jgi:hypothetical protein
MALVDTSHNQNRDSTFFDNLINVFMKPKTPDERFIPFREGLDKLEQNVQVCLPCPPIHSSRTIHVIVEYRKVASKSD